MSADQMNATENRITHGCDHLGRSCAAWLGAMDIDEGRTKAAVSRAIGGAAAGWFAGGMLYELGPIAWGASAVLLALAVWAAGGEAGEVDTDEEFGPTELLELLHDLAGGGNLHLSAVREQLIEETGRDWTAQDVTALCRAADVPTRPGVRVPGAVPPVTTGIHRDDLPPLPRPTSDAPVGVVGAGHGDNNNTNMTVEEVGQAGLIVKHGPPIRQEARR